jgi:hydrogenase maturation protein HypF
MSPGPRERPPHVPGLEIRVRGRVQGVGFRPTVWRLAHELGLSGEVLNDAEGVVIRAAGEGVTRLADRLLSEAPPLSRIERIDSRPVPAVPGRGFRIAETVGGAAQTEVAPDAALCEACAREVLSPVERRYRYPFANCTHCGPRFSIINAIPYDRAVTTMAPFRMCEACLAEYGDPSDRRFHAEAIACPACGPRLRLVRLGDADEARWLEDPDLISALLLDGHIVALKGIGGYQLACDATNAAAVTRLRDAKLREAKPFALMARDLDVVRRYCSPDGEEERQLASPEGPIVLMQATGPEPLPEAVAPGLRTVGFMLPTTPLHLLALRQLDRPVVMTSGNLSDEPQITDDREACQKLRRIADYALIHDRAIANRIDDSVVRVMGGAPRLIRRARGYAPAPITLPPGFDAAPDLLAMGGELKATFCLLKDGEAILSQHQGDLEDAATYDDFRRNLSLYAALFDHAPRALVADMHPEYLSAKLARERSGSEGLALIEVQHHHAHVAACLAENSRPLDAPPVLGIVLDGMGWGGDGTIWGGEFLLANYRSAKRLGMFKPVAMPGGAQAVREPWRSLYAHLVAGIGWAAFTTDFGRLELYRYLSTKPLPLIDTMILNGINSPASSSCGRLFDAVAAALGLCRDRQRYEGEAAARLEAAASEAVRREEAEGLAYPFAIVAPQTDHPLCLDSMPMWKALLGDLAAGTPVSVMSARFHRGLARAIAEMARKLASPPREGGSCFDTVALSGGCLQNEVLFGELVRRLEAEAFTVLSHRKVPANDGGLALGQAAVGAARLLAAAS